MSWMACGSDDSSRAQDGDSGTSSGNVDSSAEAADGGLMGVDATATMHRDTGRNDRGDAGSDASADASPASPSGGDGGYGVILIYFEPNREFTAVAANFVKGSPPQCAEQTFGPCVVDKCPVTPDPPFESAGTLTVENRAGEIGIQPDSKNVYSYDSDNPDGGPHVNGYPQVGVWTTGDAVPALSVNVLAPLDAPHLTQPASPTISLSGDLSVSWTGSYNNGVNLRIDQPPVSILCQFTYEVHYGVIPAAALANLTPTGPGVQEAAIGLDPAIATLITQSGWQYAIVTGIYPEQPLTITP
jgi:hypothetical protein